MNKPTDKTPTDKPQRTALPTDIGAGETQFLRYSNGLIRGVWGGAGSVAVTWSTGFFMSVPPDAWNDRTFINHAQSARLVQGDEIFSAEAFFERVREENKQYAARVVNQTDAPRKKMTP